MLIYTISSLIFTLISIVFAYFETYTFSVFLLLFSSVFYFISIKGLIGGYNKITIFFVFFYLLYGVSAPITIMLGGSVADIFSKPYDVVSYLYLYFISMLGLTVGIVATITLKKYDVNQKPIVISDESSYLFIVTGFVVCVISLFFDIVNNLRIGFDSLFLDKAIYQSKIQNLSLSLPTSKLYICGLVSFCIGISRNIKTSSQFNYKKHCFFMVLLFVPTLTFHLITGQRGFLLALFGSIFLSLFYFDSIKSVRKKYYILAFLLYFSFVLLTIIRGVLGFAIETGDGSLIVDRLFNDDRFISNVNPASNEFGAPFGNINEYIINGGSELKLGESYINSHAVIIPQFIYPGIKPIQEIYQFRDKYFPTEKERSDIASTGYSPILEAYINFREFGVFFIFLILGWMLVIFEIIRANSVSIVYPIFYVSLFTLMRSFHRSGFDLMIGELFWALILSFFVALLLGFLSLFKTKST